MTKGQKVKKTSTHPNFVTTKGWRRQGKVGKVGNCTVVPYLDYWFTVCQIVLFNLFMNRCH